MSKRAKALLFWACGGTVWALNETDAWRRFGVSDHDWLVLLGSFLAGAFFYIVHALVPAQNERTPERGGVLRGALTVVWGLAVAGLLLDGGIDLDGSALFFLAPLCASITLVAPRSFERAAWLILHGIVGLYVFSGPPAGDARIVFRVIAAAIHAALIAGGTFQLGKVLHARRAP